MRNLPMQILIVSATTAEIGPFLDKFPTADHLVTGVGIPAMVYHLTKRLQQIDYDLVMLAGIAGTFSSNTRLGEVVVVKTDCFADIGVNEKGSISSIFEMGLADADEFPFSKGRIGSYTELPGFRTVDAITINRISDESVYIDQLISKYKPEIESMEGAAFHYVCALEKVPFIQLRSISNDVGERNKANWKMKEAILALNVALENALNHFTKSND